MLLLPRNLLRKFDKNQKLFLDVNFARPSKQTLKIKIYALKKKHVKLVENAIENHLDRSVTNLQFSSEIVVGHIAYFSFTIEACIKTFS